MWRSIRHNADIAEEVGRITEGRGAEIVLDLVVNVTVSARACERWDVPVGW
jgi:hypothetical protein